MAEELTALDWLCTIRTQCNSVEVDGSLKNHQEVQPFFQKPSQLKQHQQSLQLVCQGDNSTSNRGLPDETELLNWLETELPCTSKNDKTTQGNKENPSIRHRGNSLQAFIPPHSQPGITKLISHVLHRAMPSALTSLQITNNIAELYPHLTRKQRTALKARVRHELINNTIFQRSNKNSMATRTEIALKSYFDNACWVLMQESPLSKDHKQKIPDRHQNLDHFRTSEKEPIKIRISNSKLQKENRKRSKKRNSGKRKRANVSFVDDIPQLDYDTVSDPEERSNMYSFNEHSLVPKEQSSLANSANNHLWQRQHQVSIDFEPNTKLGLNNCNSSMDISCDRDNIYTKGSLRERDCLNTDKQSQKEINYHQIGLDFVIPEKDLFGYPSSPPSDSLSSVPTDNSKQYSSPTLMQTTFSSWDSFSFCPGDDDHIDSISMMPYCSCPAPSSQFSALTDASRTINCTTPSATHAFDLFHYMESKHQQYGLIDSHDLNLSSASEDEVISNTVLCELKQAQKNKESNEQPCSSEFQEALSPSISCSGRSSSSLRNLSEVSLEDDNAQVSSVVTVMNTLPPPPPPPQSISAAPETMTELVSSEQIPTHSCTSAVETSEDLAGTSLTPTTVGIPYSNSFGNRSLSQQNDRLSRKHYEEFTSATTIEPQIFFFKNKAIEPKGSMVVGNSCNVSAIFLGKEFQNELTLFNNELDDANGLFDDLTDPFAI